MRLRLSLALLFAASAQVFCQQPAANSPAPAIPKDPRAFFELAVPHYDFSDPKLKPWHLKASYEIYSFGGKLATKGTWEYWWGSPKVRRRSWERPGMSRTEWTTKDYTIFRKASGEPTDFFENGLEDLLIYPGPNYEWIKSGWLKLSFKQIGNSTSSPICIAANPRGRSMPEPLHMLSDYCFDPETAAVLATRSKFMVRHYSQFVVMQDHYIARHVVEQIEGQAKLVVSVDTINGIADTDPALVPPPDAVPLPGHAHYTSDSPNLDRGKSGKWLKTPPPLTVDARDRGGAVLLVVETGVDGEVRSVEVLAAPSEHLADTAADTVKRWKFKPATVNGNQIESEFPVQMVF